jgi:hypothetical protein
MQELKIQTNKFVSGNDFSKHFKLGDIDLHLHKAYDEDSNLHFIVFCIPHIVEVNASDIKYPIGFEVEKERDEVFSNFKVDDGLDFMDKLVEEIRENDKNKVPLDKN